MRTLASALCFALLACSAHAQAPSLQQRLTLHLPGVSEPLRVAVNKTTQTVYVVGSFVDSMVVGGFALASRGDVDGFVLAMNEELQPTWLMQFGGPGRDVATSVCILPNNRIVVGGYCGAQYATTATYTIGETTYSGRGEADAVVFCIDTSGTVRWSRNDGGSRPDLVRNIAIADSSTLYVTGDFFGVSRFDSSIVGVDNELQHGYLQCLNQDGHQRFVRTATSVKRSDVASSASLVSCTGIDDDGFSVVLRFSGSVVVAQDTLTRNEDDFSAQHFIQLSSAGSYLGYSTVDMCADYASAWSFAPRSSFGAFCEQTSFCSAGTSNALYATDVTSGIRTRLLSGVFNPVHMAILARTDLPPSLYLVCGSYTGSCDLVDTPDSPDFVANPDATDGALLAVTTDNHTPWVITAQSSTRGEFSDADGADRFIVAVCRVDTSSPLIPDSVPSTWSDWHILKFGIPPTSVEGQRTPNPLQLADKQVLVDVYDLAGNLVVAHPLALGKVMSLPVGLYLLRYSEGLSLCYVGTYDISFPVSYSTSR